MPLSLGPARRRPFRPAAGPLLATSRAVPVRHSMVIPPFRGTRSSGASSSRDPPPKKKSEWAPASSLFAMGPDEGFGDPAGDFHVGQLVQASCSALSLFAICARAHRLRSLLAAPRRASPLRAAARRCTPRRAVA